MTKKPLIFCGSSHEVLGDEIAKELNTDLGKISLGVFPDGETSVEIREDVRGQDVFVLQSIALQPNHFLMEMLIIIDALKRSSVKSITAIIPYFGYCRQDRKDRQGVPITAKLVANLLTAAGISRLMTCDLHAGQLEGFFEIPVDHLHCQSLLGKGALKALGLQESDEKKDCVVVAPDIGSIKIAEKLAKRLRSGYVLIEKERISDQEIKMTLIGTLSSKNVLLIDDICSTAGTLLAATKLCREHGAERVVAAATHAICAGAAAHNIEQSTLDAFVTTNTIPTFDRFQGKKKIEVVSIAPLLAQAILSVE